MPGAHDQPSGLLDHPSGIAPIGSADPLSDVLRTIRLRGALFFLTDATTPWCVDIPEARAFARTILPGARHVISYHVAVEGAGLARIPGAPPVHFKDGDTIVFPHGDPYLMANAEGVPPEFDAEETLQFFRDLAAGRLPWEIPEGGGGEPHTRVICGFLGCDLAPFNPLIASLPRLLHIRRPPGGAPDLLDRLTGLAMHEARRPRPGGESIRLGLTELMFVELLRRHVQSLPPGSTGWLAGLGEPAVARALGLLHARPAEDWSLEALAHEAGVSRSVLAERFATWVGQPPMRYLKLWRMQLAARMLADGPARVGQIAQAVGFRSEAAFSRTFRQVTGVAPSAWRQSGTREAIAPGRALTAGSQGSGYGHSA